MKHVSAYYPEILLSEIPRQYDAPAQSLLQQTDIPEVMVEDSPRLDAVADSSPEAKYMSRVRHHRVQCHSCGHGQSFAVWSRMNGSVDPWLNEMIASGRLFSSKCRRCGETQIVSYHTLYLNIDKPFAIWLRMPNSSSDFTIRIPSQEYFNDLNLDFTFRTVTSPLDLAEKIQVFLDGHDDILVEFIKTSLCMQRGIDLVQPLHYLKTQKKLLSGSTITFGVIGPHETQEILYPLSSQKGKLEQIMTKIRPSLSAPSTEWHCVDRGFIMELLQNSGMMRRLDV